MNNHPFHGDGELKEITMGQIAPLERVLGDTEGDAGTPLCESSDGNATDARSETTVAPTESSPPERTVDETVQAMTAWIATHQSLVSQAQSLANLAVKEGLVESNRRLPFEITAQGPGFMVSCHVDHPVQGHFYLHLHANGSLDIDPAAPLWFERRTSLDPAEGFVFIRNLAAGALLKKFRAMEDALANGDRVRMNNLLATHVAAYRRKIDPALRELTDFLATVENLHLNLPQPGGGEKLVKLADFKGSLAAVLTAMPDSFYVVNAGLKFETDQLSEEDAEIDVRERAPVSVAVGNRIMAFHRMEQMESALLYAAQRLGVSYGYKVDVFKKQGRLKLATAMPSAAPAIRQTPGVGSPVLPILHTFSALKAESGLTADDTLVTVSPEGYVLVRPVVEAEEIVLRSKLEL